MIKYEPTFSKKQERRRACNNREIITPKFEDVRMEQKKPGGTGRTATNKIATTPCRSVSPVPVGDGMDRVVSLHDSSVVEY